MDRNTLGFCAYWMHENSIFEMLIWFGIHLKYLLISAILLLFHNFFVENNSNCMFLLTIDFVQVWYIGTPPSYVSVRYVGMNVAVI